MMRADDSEHRFVYCVHPGTVLASLLFLVAAGCGDDNAARDTDASHGLRDAAADGSALDGASACPTPLPDRTVVETASAAALTIIGDTGSTLGIFDPSIAYPADAEGGAMSYSSVRAPDAISTRIALSNDAGETWIYVAEANTPEETTVASTSVEDCPDGTCEGRLIHEVSSLIHDATDPDADRRWKLFTHRYLALPDTRIFYQYGYIALSTAPAAEGPWSDATKLIGWESAAPMSSVGARLIAQDVPELDDCVVLSEPGALVREGGIDLSLGCVSFATGSNTIRVVLLRSTDHGETFGYVGTLLDADDATCLGGIGQVNAPNLFTIGAQTYLIASPQGPTGYIGCVVVPIDDPDEGTLRRTATGALDVVRVLQASPTRFTGACTVGPGATASGYVVPIAFDSLPVFRFFATGAAAP